jgi:hypothetical protein
MSSGPSRNPSVFLGNSGPWVKIYPIYTSVTLKYKIAKFIAPVQEWVHFAVTKVGRVQGSLHRCPKKNLNLAVNLRFRFSVQGQCNAKKN